MLIFWGFAIVYALRVNLSVAIVDMVKTSNKNGTAKGECSKNETLHEGSHFQSYSVNHNKTDDTYDWDSEQQGLVLGSFFYGYITTQLVGGYLADRFGAKVLFGAGVGCTAVFTIITKPIADLGFGYMIALRVLEGLVNITSAGRHVTA